MPDPSIIDSEVFSSGIVNGPLARSGPPIDSKFYRTQSSDESGYAPITSLTSLSPVCLQIKKAFWPGTSVFTNRLESSRPEVSQTYPDTYSLLADGRICKITMFELGKSREMISRKRKWKREINMV